MRRVKELPVRIVTEPTECAEAAGLRHVSDQAPGIHRVKKRGAFQYFDAAGKAVRDEATLERIRKLAIPPAWTEVWICQSPNGHIQATGRDAKGRKQHRYHARWRETRDETKYTRLIAFGQTLPKIRERLRRDLALPGLPRDKVLAAAVAILETGLIRVGNREYARQNHSYGLTTMQDRHAEISGARIRFHFRGKSGKTHDVDIEDKRLARIVKNCQDIPGQELFQYLDEAGRRQAISSADVNAYLREISQCDFTAKDFRTWTGTVLAAATLREFERASSAAQAKKNILRMIEAVASHLGNTPSICRKCYIHPHIIEAYLDGALLEAAEKKRRVALAHPVASLRPEEESVLTLLRERLAQSGGERRENKLLRQLKSSLKHRRVTAKNSIR